MTATADPPKGPAAPGAPAPEPLPPLEIGGRPRSGWREDVQARVRDLDTLVGLMQAQTPLPPASAATLIRGIEAHLKAAHDAASEKWSLAGGISGGAVSRTQANLHAIEADLLRLAPADYMRGQLPGIQAYARGLLPRQHPVRERLDEIVASVKKGGDLTVADQEQVISALREANAENRRTVARLRSFRNVLLWTALLLGCGALAMMIIGALWPDAVTICFVPDEVVCATETSPLPEGEDVDAVIRATVSGWDVPLIEIVGMLAAGISAATSLRRISGTSTPYSLPVALAVLKIPTGALTALLGLLLMRGEFVPGLTALDTPAQIVAWAVVFGASQQLFTRLVDDQAQTVLDKVGGTSAPAASGTQP